MAAVLLLLLVGLGEGVIRWIDGYSLRHLTLAAAPARPLANVVTGTSRDTADARYFDKIALAPGVDASWYPKDPPAHTSRPLPPEMATRAERYNLTDPLGAFFAWNPAYLKLQLCAGQRFGSLGILDDFFTFEPPPGTQYPTYRHLSNISPPFWFPTNRFGWRGPDLTLNKPPRTIRIAFAGSSMTIDGYGLPYSHIEYIGEWLNLWTTARGYPFKVEVINLARTGIDSNSVAGAVVQEGLPLEPDLVIFDGANDYKPGMVLQLPKEGLPAPPGFGGLGPKWRVEQYSAVARRVRALVDSRRLGVEPVKPSFPIQWPADVDETNPDLGAVLPMALSETLANLDAMRVAVHASGGQFAVTSQVAMFQDGLRLTLPRDETLFNALNVTYYPLTYAQARRLMDFQNRVFQKYAAQHGLPFLDKATISPLDPELFLDVMHMTQQGNRLQSWHYLQWLVRWIDQEVGAGRLPREMQHPRDAHPAFPNGDYPLLSRASIMASCQ